MRAGILKVGNVLLVLMVFVAGTSLVAAQRGGWVRLGSSHVDGNVDHDKIKVGSGEGSFRALRLDVRGSAVKFDHIIVRYENGQQQQVRAQFVVANGSSSPAMDLPGNYRNIKNVELWYERGEWGSSKPEVTLYGRR